MLVMSKQQIEDPMVYRVGILRTDLGFDLLYVLDDMDRDKAVKKLGDLVSEWTSSVENKRPFHLTDQLRSFSPSLILEIRIDQVPYSVFNRVNSPYEKQMQTQGTSSFMQNTFQNR
jgi:predicted nucleotidyltransferase